MQPTSYGAAPTRVLGRRIGAYVIDTILVVILSAVAFLATADRMSVDEALRRPDCHLEEIDSLSSSLECDDKFVINLDDEAYIADLGPIILVSLGATVLHVVVVQGLVGATLGKLICGIRVVTADGSVCGIGRALLRWVILVASGFVLLLPEIITVLVQKDRRRLGDLAAGTWVVHSSYAGRPVSSAAPMGPYAVAAGSAPVAPPSGGGPQWDPARNAYIQWDPERNQWMQWSDTESRWKLIDT